MSKFLRQPTNLLLISLIGYPLLIKVLPFLLMYFGLNIRSDGFYPWSLTPIFAVGIFSVAMLRDLRWGFAIPVIAFALGDLLIGALMAMRFGIEEGLGACFYPGMPFVYLGLLLSSASGLLVRMKRWVPTILTAAITGPTLFFLITNWSSWQYDLAGIYSRELNGLWQSYIAGIPYYRNSLISTIGFSALLFSPLGIRLAQRSEVFLSTATKPAFNGRSSESASL